MESFIREEKYAYDLKHFPCLKINANRACGLLSMVAHNLLSDLEDQFVTIKNKLFGNIYCNAHARRRFKEAEKNFSSEVDYYLRCYRIIYRFESGLGL